MTSVYKDFFSFQKRVSGTCPTPSSRGYAPYCYCKCQSLSSRHKLICISVQGLWNVIWFTL